MEEKQIKELVDRLPETQRKIARRKIEAAIRNGWRNIELDPPEGGKPHHYDLFGIRPSGEKEILLDAD